jgi:acyl dehydratase
MAAVTISIDKLGEYVGERFFSDWHEVTQGQVDLFAEASGDHQWIHVDPQRAVDGPFGQTVAHGYLTLSMAPVVLDEALEITGTRWVVNYGANRVRFPAPLPVGNRVRAEISCTAVDEVAGGVQVVWALKFDLEEGEKPVCVADLLVRYGK